MITTYNRQQIEQFLVQEQTVLQECVNLLHRKIPLSDWPDNVRAAFLLALQAGEGREAYKAFSTARHLRLHRRFPDQYLPGKPTPLQRRCAERLRANLSKLVKLGAGSYLET
ncbi:hypothetical protein U27_01369 [Candidatus Vecturithrix granuli]|uniref:Uncharacterized protein n=1 Tax=Vecturithrix granuli TaxID=1499967 RepID=A0A081CA63_VECG1|nr:hypothetical protein U27_01369 [Candidatus Vecturithrix granuli]